MLNSREILEKGIITGPIDDDMIAQVGIDLRVVEVKSLDTMGVIPAQGKTILAQDKSVARESASKLDVGIENAVWQLNPGAYRVEFEQGCNIPNDKVLLIRQRSSLLRNGTILHSSVFDPGFKTNKMGTVITVLHPIIIEWKARIAQAYVHECTPVAKDDLYDGQFQEDKQRGSNSSDSI